MALVVDTDVASYLFKKETRAPRTSRGTCTLG